MNQHVINIFVAYLTFVFCSCGQQNSAERENQGGDKGEALNEDAKWFALFDGETTTGWRGYNQKTIPEGWVVENGTLKSLGKGGDIGGDIVYGNREFENFELKLQWKISEGGNSGIFYHVVEDLKYKAAYETAPEYQLIDDLDFPQPLEEWQKVGADYAMYFATDKIVKRAGEWNTARIRYTPEKAEYWLNGKKTVEFVPYSDEWTKRRNSGKWDDFPDYAISKKGLIGLQDHGSNVWFKNIKIREL